MGIFKKISEIAKRSEETNSSLSSSGQKQKEQNTKTNASTSIEPPSASQETPPNKPEKSKNQTLKDKLKAQKEIEVQQEGTGLTGGMSAKKEIHQDVKALVTKPGVEPKGSTSSLVQTESSALPDKKIQVLQGGVDNKLGSEDTNSGEVKKIVKSFGVAGGTGGEIANNDIATTKHTSQGAPHKQITPVNIQDPISGAAEKNPPHIMHQQQGNSANTATTANNSATGNSATTTAGNSAAADSTTADNTADSTTTGDTIAGNDTATGNTAKGTGTGSANGASSATGVMGSGGAIVGALGLGAVMANSKKTASNVPKDSSAMDQPSKQPAAPTAPNAAPTAPNMARGTAPTAETIIDNISSNKPLPGPPNGPLPGPPNGLPNRPPAGDQSPEVTQREKSTRVFTAPNGLERTTETRERTITEVSSPVTHEEASRMNSERNSENQNNSPNASEGASPAAAVPLAAAAAPLGASGSQSVNGAASGGPNRKYMDTPECDKSSYLSAERERGEILYETYVYKRRYFLQFLWTKRHFTISRDGTLKYYRNPSATRRGEFKLGRDIVGFEAYKAKRGSHKHRINVVSNQEDDLAFDSPEHRDEFLYWLNKSSEK
ncbi:hypothetical protein NEFER01_1765 [Nematocida sp. LUAm1]|nr:hypothetical protein NEFER02_1610 [Nematocida sp. LUAm2]KAI5178629.1 hypothetical protein NEFER01_1765 [Nematocida sp. LUAm1]